MKRRFQNALCLARCPDAYHGMSVRHATCRRFAEHVGEHRSWSRWWDDGSAESEVRLCTPDAQVTGSSVCGSG